MRQFLLFALLMMTASLPGSAQDAAPSAPQVFEMRTYYAHPGKLDALHARFRDHTTRLFTKHGMTHLGYWVPMENPQEKLVYVLGYPSRESRDRSWKQFAADEEWTTAKSRSETQGPLVAKVEELFMEPTAFSPAMTPSTGAAKRVFELRTYTTTPGNLPALLDRFRNHTTALFSKHGMQNLFYWKLTTDQPAAQNTLLYILAHENVAAAKASFAAFRADPDWIAAKARSEEKAGGSLTVPDGVRSEFLEATDYSPTR